MSSNKEKVIKYNDRVVEVIGEVEDNTGKDSEVPTKVIPMPRPPPPFPQRLVKKTEDGKYWHFLMMLKLLSIIVPLVEALEQMLGYAKFMKDRFQNKDRSLSRMMIECSIVVLFLQVRSLFLVQSGHYIL